MLISKNLHWKSSQVSIKTRSTPVSLSFIDQVTEFTTVKWSIDGFQSRVETAMLVHKIIANYGSCFAL